MAEPFWNRYERYVALLTTPPEGEAMAFTEEEVAAVERELELRLPAVLRDLYLKNGRRDDLHGAQDYLRAPDDLYVDEDDYLVFYDENQGVYTWGVKVSGLPQDDPPVYFVESEDEGWTPFADSLSEFLLGILFHQLSHGGAPCGAVAVVTTDGLLHLTADGWKHVPLTFLCEPAGDVYLRQGQAVYVPSQGWQSEPTVEVRVLATARELLDAMAEVLKTDLRHGWDNAMEREYTGPTEEEREAAREEARQRQAALSVTPFGGVTCGNCGAPLRVWADTRHKRCGRCETPFDPALLTTAA